MNALQRKGSGKFPLGVINSSVPWNYEYLEGRASPLLCVFAEDLFLLFHKQGNSMARGNIDKGS